MCNIFCASLWQEIDGQALLLLTLPTVQELMEVKLGPAIKLCHLIEKLKIAFYEQYAVWMICNVRISDVIKGCMVIIHIQMFILYILFQSEKHSQREVF